LAQGDNRSVAAQACDPPGTCADLPLTESQEFGARLSNDSGLAETDPQMPPIYRPIRMLRFLLDHRFTQAHLSDYADEDLSEHDRGRVEQHVGMCPRCRHLLATLMKTLEGLHALGAEPAAAGGVADSVIARLRRR
jgi:Putative zinc-finger